MLMLSLSLLFLVTGLTNPKMGTKLETVKRRGVDIVFAIDVSKSMDAEDIAPSRLEKAKRLVSKIVDNLVSDRIGIIAYAGEGLSLVGDTNGFMARRPRIIFTRNIGVTRIWVQVPAGERVIGRIGHWTWETNLFRNERTDLQTRILGFWSGLGGGTHFGKRQVDRQGKRSGNKQGRLRFLRH